MATNTYKNIPSIPSNADVAAKANKSGDTFTGNVDIDNGQAVRFYETDANGSNKITVKAPDSLVADYTLTLPPDDGTANQVLKTDGNGVTAWVTPSAGATAFTSLTDAPASYSGHANKVVSVNAGQTALEFTTPSISPVWSNFTPGLNVVGGAGNVLPVYTNNISKYMQLGKLVFIYLEWDADGGADGAGTGELHINLPVAASADSYGGGRIQAIGHITNGGAAYTLLLQNFDATDARLMYGTGSVHLSLTGLQQSDPDRRLCASFFYMAA